MQFYVNLPLKNAVKSGLDKHGELPVDINLQVLNDEDRELISLAAAKNYRKRVELRSLILIDTPVASDRLLEVDNLTEVAVIAALKRSYKKVMQEVSKWRELCLKQLANEDFDNCCLSVDLEGSTVTHNYQKISALKKVTFPEDMHTQVADYNESIRIKNEEIEKEARDALEKKIEKKRVEIKKQREETQKQKQARFDQLTEVVMQHGDDNLKERWAKGLAKRREAMDILWKKAFPCLPSKTPYVKPYEKPEQWLCDNCGEEVDQYDLDNWGSVYSSDKKTLSSYEWERAKLVLKKFGKENVEYEKWILDDMRGATEEMVSGTFARVTITVRHFTLTAFYYIGW